MENIEEIVNSGSTRFIISALVFIGAVIIVIFFIDTWLNVLIKERQKQRAKSITS